MQNLPQAPPVPKCKYNLNPKLPSYIEKKIKPGTETSELAKIKAPIEEENKELALEIEGVFDPSQQKITDYKELTFCLRCEKFARTSNFWSHSNTHASEILPWLYLGSYQNASNEVEMKTRLRITHILNCANECGEFLQGEFHYLKLDMVDNRDVLEFQQGFDFINQVYEHYKQGKDSKILVHCVQGMSRSASIVIAWLMQENNWTLRESFFFVKDRRKIISPAPYFVDQLMEYELKMKGCLSVRKDELCNDKVRIW